MKKSIILLVLTVLLLTSCLIPDNYEMNITVNKIGSVDYEYKGELNYAPALEAMSKGEYDDDTRDEVDEIVVELSKDEGYSSIKNLGKGKLSVSYENDVERGSDHYFLDKDLKFYAFEYDDNLLTISGVKIEDEGRKSMEELGIKLKGKLNITIPKKMKVTDNNADKKVKLDKKTMQYQWDLDLNSEQPVIEIKL